MITKLYWIISFIFTVHTVKKFPHLPDCFKTTIHGTSRLNAKQSLQFNIEQYHCVARDGIICKSEFRSEDLMIGFIYDQPNNHSIKYNYTHCSLDELPSTNNPFQEFRLPNIPLIDAFNSFQNGTFISSLTPITSTDGISKTVFTHNPDHSYPYFINVTVDNNLVQIDEVVIYNSSSTAGEWLAIMRYNDVILLNNNPSWISQPPHDVFCRSDKQKDVPFLGNFYMMELRIMSEYYIKQESLSLIKIAEYVNEGMISIGYHATTDSIVHYTNIIHDYATGEVALINRDMELCTRHQIILPDNYTLADKKVIFKSEILSNMNFFERTYFVLFYEVLELMKSGSVAWQYQGRRVVDSTLCNVWSYPLRASWIAEITFSAGTVQLRENSYSTLRQSVPVSVDLYRVESADTTLPAISFRVSDFQIDSNPVSTELLFDTSVCFESEKSCVVQFRLNITFSTLHVVGLGNVKRAIVLAVTSKTNISSQQIHHVTVGSSNFGESLVTFTAYHGIGANLIDIILFKDRLKAAVDSRMYASFTNEDRNVVRIAYTVPGSLVLDYKQSSSVKHWSVSLAATVSLCIGTLFIGVIVGVVAVGCINRRKVTNSGDRVTSSSKYRRFQDEDVDEVVFEEVPDTNL